MTEKRELPFPCASFSNYLIHVWQGQLVPMCRAELHDREKVYLPNRVFPAATTSSCKHKHTTVNHKYKNINFYGVNSQTGLNCFQYDKKLYSFVLLVMRNYPPLQHYLVHDLLWLLHFCRHCVNFRLKTVTGRYIVHKSQYIMSGQ